MLCQEHNLYPGLHPEPEQSRFPQSHGHQWTWTHPSGCKHQLDHRNSKCVSSLYKCYRPYLQLGETWLCTIALVSIFLVAGLRAIKGKSRKRAPFKIGGSCMLEKLNLANKTRNYIAAWKTIYSLCSEDHWQRSAFPPPVTNQQRQLQRFKLTKQLLLF